jgi:DnaJ-class molecular chaperone
MKRTAMYEPCPVCHGTKKLKQRTKILGGYRESETACWACRGSGYADYKEGIEVTASRIDEMYKSLGH